MVAHCVQVIRGRVESSRARCGLVVGCGCGDEVVYIRQAFGSSHIVGFDLEPKFSRAARRHGCVAVADAQWIPFPAEAFDFVAAFHSLEHVADPERALDEIGRVLRPGGWFYVGVPNRSRLVGYLGSFDATTWQKITWNLADWWARLRGRFRNSAGAHAGFDKQELQLLLGRRFDKVEFLTEEFVRFKYGGRLPRAVLDFLLAPSVAKHSVPALYAICQRG